MNQAAKGRRAFLRRAIGIAGVPTAIQASDIRRSPIQGSTRQQSAYRRRQNAALFQNQQPEGEHLNNGDEGSLPGWIGNFSKGLPHAQNGEVASGAYQSLMSALVTGSVNALEGISRGSGMKFVNPLASLSFQMEGSDSHRLGMDPPPAFSSAEAAAEMVELYWQALARDIPFTAYAASPVTQAAVAELNRLSAFRGPTANGKVTPDTLFRGKVSGGLAGPSISQFFWQPVPVNSTAVQQLYTAGAPGIDYLNTWDEWLVIQTGVPPFRQWTSDPRPKYIYNGRSLAEMGPLRLPVSGVPQCRADSA